jgi:LPXTG-motif cell wall-anchored protein
MTYLTNWVAAQSPSGNQLSGNDSNSNNIIMITIVSVIGLSTILGYYFIRKKKEA